MTLSKVKLINIVIKVERISVEKSAPNRIAFHPNHPALFSSLSPATAERPAFRNDTPQSALNIQAQAYHTPWRRYMHSLQRAVGTTDERVYVICWRASCYMQTNKQVSTIGFGALLSFITAESTPVPIGYHRHKECINTNRSSSNFFRVIHSPTTRPIFYGSNSAVRFVKVLIKNTKLQALQDSETSSTVVSNDFNAYTCRVNTGLVVATHRTRIVSGGSVARAFSGLVGLCKLIHEIILLVGPSIIMIHS